jgi:hypothetical protein
VGRGRGRSGPAGDGDAGAAGRGGGARIIPVTRWCWRLRRRGVQPGGRRGDAGRAWLGSDPRGKRDGRRISGRASRDRRPGVRVARLWRGRRRLRAQWSRTRVRVGQRTRCGPAWRLRRSLVRRGAASIASSTASPTTTSSSPTASAQRRPRPRIHFSQELRPRRRPARPPRPAAPAPQAPHERSQPPLGLFGVRTRLRGVPVRAGR